MTQATPYLRDFAERLIAYDASADNSFERRPLAAFHACEKLRPHLVTYMGNAGFRALLSRALALAGEGVPWLRAVHVKADGSLEGMEELGAQLVPDELLEGRVVLLAKVLGLLVAFIGEKLTLRLVLDVWPKVPLNDFGFDLGGENEKTK